MNIRKSAKFLAYVSATGCMAAIVLGIMALANGDLAGLTTDCFLLLVSAICWWVNLSAASGPDWPSTPEF